jgi:hypothetical protein
MLVNEFLCGTFLTHIVSDENICKSKHEMHRKNFGILKNVLKNILLEKDSLVMLRQSCLTKKMIFVKSALYTISPVALI